MQQDKSKAVSKVLRRSALFIVGGFLCLWFKGILQHREIAIDRNEERSASRPEIMPSLPPARELVIGLPDVDAPRDPAGSELAPPPSLIINGSVVLQRSGVPVVGAQVRFRRPTSQNEKSVQATAVTDEAGDFAFELPPTQGWNYGDVFNVAVYINPNQVVLAGMAVLAPFLVLQVPAGMIAHGVITDTIDWSLGAAIALFDDSSGNMIKVAQADVAPDGSFETQVFLEAIPESLVLGLVMRGGMFTARCSSVEILGDKGARVFLGLEALSVVVSDDLGSPISGARIRLGERGIAGSMLGEWTADAQGRIMIVVPSADLQFCASAPGFASTNGMIGRGEFGGLVRVHLRALLAGDGVSGIVLYSNGEPAEAAAVTAFPLIANGELGVAGSASASTAKDGRFFLQIGADASLGVVAFKRLLGSSETVPVEPGQGDIVLVLPNGGGLRLAFDSSDFPATVGPGLIGYVAVGRTYAVVHSGVSASSPIVLDELPEDEYNVYAYMASLGLFFEGSVDVTGGEISWFKLAGIRPRYVTGVVVDGDDLPQKNCQVMLTGLWPTEAESHWAVGRTGVNGEFKLMAGTSPAATLIVLKEGRQLLREEVASDVPLRLVLESP